MGEIRKYDLEELESEYRKLTTSGEQDAAAKMRSIFALLRYDLNNEKEVHMEYRSGLQEPILMRIIKTEKDLDRWIEQRFIRLAEF
jgi:hypothetical protein